MIQDDRQHTAILRRILSEEGNMSGLFINEQTNMLTMNSLYKDSIVFLLVKLSKRQIQEPLEEVRKSSQIISRSKRFKSQE